MASVHTRSNGTIVVKDSHGTGKNRKQITRTFGRGPAARAEAEAYAQSLNEKKKALKEQDDSSNPFQPGKPVYADQIAVAWYQDKKAAGRARWVDEFAHTLNKEILPEISNVPVDQLTQQFLVSFIHRIRKGRSPITIDRYISYLKCMFQWAVKHRIITRNPLELWSKRKEAPKDFKLTHEDVKKIIDVSPPHLAWAVEVAYNLGVRTGQSELLALEWRHVDWENGYVRVYGRKTKTWRRVKVSANFLEKLVLKKAEAQTPYLVEYQGRQVKRISKAFRSACRRAGISEDIISYDIRHLFCSTLLSKGASVRTVSAMMGHSNPSMTLGRYGHIMPGDEERAAALLPELD